MTSILDEGKLSDDFLSFNLRREIYKKQKNVKRLIYLHNKVEIK